MTTGPDSADTRTERSERPSWMDAPVAVRHSVWRDVDSLIDALPARHFPMSKREIQALLAGWINDKGSM